MTFFKRNEFATTKTRNWFGALRTFLREKITIAIGTVWLFFFRSKFQASQLFATTSACEALLVPRISFIGNSTSTNNLRALAAALSIFRFVAGHTDDLVFARNKTLGTDWLFAFDANKAFFVPLLATVFVLSHASLEDTLAAITTGGKTFVVAVRTVQLFFFRSKWSVSQRSATGGALEAFFMPVTFFEGQVL